MTFAPPKLDYVSPLPPVRSGIADYSRDLLDALARTCDVRVVAVPGQEISEELREKYRPVSADVLGKEGRLPLYQMGNNLHHEPVQKLALEIPGVVTLHDVVLHHLLIESTLAHDDFDGYARRLAADHGWIGELVAKARWWGELSSSAMFELSANRTLLRKQRGVLVHSQWAADEVVEENPDLAVRVVSMGIPLPQPVDRSEGHAFRERRGLPSGVPLLGSLGFQTPIKRTSVAIEALAEAGLEDAHLLIAGEVSSDMGLEEKASDLGVTDRVHITGFLPYNEFEVAIAACDLCINLRYPTAGETSASLLRVLALGRPAIVSDYAQFRELPEAAVISVPLGEDEASALAQAVGEVLAEPSRLREMGEAARSYVRAEHDPDLAATRIAEACDELRNLEPPSERELGLPAPTTLLWRDLPGEIAVEGADGPWAEGERRELEVRVKNTGRARWLATKETPGGVLLSIEWRREVGGDFLEDGWSELPRSIAPGGSHTFRFPLRRPRESRYLVIEPHIEKLSGLGAFGGPSWVSEYSDS